MQLIFKEKIMLLVFMAFLLGLPFFACRTGRALASTTNGTIDSTYKYAWSDQIGWINFAPTGTGGTYKGLIITDSTVTGYAWSDKFGWINFGPFSNNSGGGVKNTAAGVLSGYAWSNNLGWINFSGVTINSAGQFTGKTTADDIVGIINFDFTHCNNCGVKTDWRHEDTRTGGALPPVTYTTPTVPASGSDVILTPPPEIKVNPKTGTKTKTGTVTPLVEPTVPPVPPAPEFKDEETTASLNVTSKNKWSILLIESIIEFIFWVFSLFAEIIKFLWSLITSIRFYLLTLF